MCVASELTFLASVQTTNCTHPLGMSDNVLAPGGSMPTPSLESNMRSLVDCMIRRESHYGENDDDGNSDVHGMKRQREQSVTPS